MACFSPDGEYIASASDDGTVRLWRLVDGACVAEFIEHGDRVMCVAFTLDGEFLVSGARNGSVFIRPLRQLVQGYKV